MTIRVVHVGSEPIGAAAARQIAARKGFRIVAAVDIDPNKIGRDAGEVARLAVRCASVSGDLRKAAKAARPDIAVLCTSSSLKSVMPQLAELLKLRLPVVSTTEELAYPAARNRRLAKQLDQMARKARVAVPGTARESGVHHGRAADCAHIRVRSPSIASRCGACRTRLRRVPFQQEDRRRPHDANSSNNGSPWARCATWVLRNRSR